MEVGLGEQESKLQKEKLMERLARKNRLYSDLKIKSSGGLTDAFDNMFKDVFRIDDAEYDYIAEHASEDQLTHLTIDANLRGKPLTFKEKRAIICTLDNLLAKI